MFKLEILMIIMYTDILSQKIKNISKCALTFNTSFVYMMIKNIFTYFGCAKYPNFRVLICKNFVHKNVVQRMCNPMRNFV